MTEIRTIEYKLNDDKVKVHVTTDGQFLRTVRLSALPPDGLTPFAAEELAAALKEAAIIASDEQDALEEDGWQRLHEAPELVPPRPHLQDAEGLDGYTGSDHEDDYHDHENF